MRRHNRRAPKMNFNLNWKFIRQDVPGAEAPGFDDSTWTTVSLPHSFNDVDSFRKIISHSGGDLGTFKGLVWYRKHFKCRPNLPAIKSSSNSRACASRRHFPEWQASRVVRERGDGLWPGHLRRRSLRERDNVLAVKVDNRTSYVERSSNTPFEWNANDLQIRPRRHQPACLAARHGQDLSDAASLLRPGKHRGLCSCRELQHCGKECRRYSRVGGEERVGRSHHGGVVGRDCRSKRAGSRQIRRQLH